MTGEICGVQITCEGDGRPLVEQLRERAADHISSEITHVPRYSGDVITFVTDDAGLIERVVEESGTRARIEFGTSG